MSDANGGCEPWPDDIWDTPDRPAARPERLRLGGRRPFLVLAMVGLLTVGVLAGWLLVRSEPEGSAAGPQPRPPAREQRIEPPPPPAVDVAQARVQLSSLEVAAPVDDGNYDRAAFRHWIDFGGDGCDTRCTVLQQQSVAAGGRNGWWSAYDRRFLTDDSEVQIDHVVSLKEAWISGASAWDDGRREVFANDVDGELLAVSAESNEAKSWSDVAGWQPTFRSAWCELAARVVRTKSKWGLTIDPPEKAKLEQMLSTCADS